MYSYEDRMRAVQLYIKLDKRISATLGQLGYPTKNSLKAWCREYERHHDLPMCYERLKPRYSAAQKRAAVIDLCTRQGSARGVTEQLGVSRQALYTWKNQQDDAGADIVVDLYDGRWSGHQLRDAVGYSGGVWCHRGHLPRRIDEGDRRSYQAEDTHDG